MDNLLRKCLADKPFFEEQVDSRLRERDRPLLGESHPDGICVLLRFKPRSWDLKRFCQYLNMLQDVYDPEWSGVYDVLICKIVNVEYVFFYLDKDFDRSDLLYLFESIIKVPCNKSSIPANSTGENLVNGELKGAFEDAENYKRVEKYIKGVEKPFRDTSKNWKIFLLQWRPNSFLCSIQTGPWRMISGLINVLDALIPNLKR